MGPRRFSARAIWEGFPAPAPREDPGRSTLYLFHYVEPDRLGEHPLLSLYERFFRLRTRYKRGPGRLLKATYGFIPGYTRLRPSVTAPRDRVLLVGSSDAYGSAPPGSCVSWMRRPKPWLRQ